MRHTTLVLTATAVVCACTGACSAAVWAGGRRLDGGAVLAALVGAGVPGLAAALAFRRVGLGFFGMAHLVYLAAVVTLPLLGLALLGLGRSRGGPAWLMAGAALSVVPAAVGWYATHVEPYWLRMDRLTVPVDRARTGDDTVRIGVLADLQTNQVGRHERSSVDRLLGARPDVILVPGDLFQGQPDEFEAGLPALRAELARLVAPHGVYFVRGDVDVGDWADRALAGTRVVILDDRVVDVAVGDRVIRIGGNRLDYRTAPAGEVRRVLVQEREDGAISVLLSHRPDPVLELPESGRVDLTVAGHTHGGQVVIPGVGPPVTFSAVPRAVGRGGLHAVGGNAIYVSPGVGIERSQAPQVRLFNRPAVAVLDLVDAMPGREPPR